MVRTPPGAVPISIEHASELGAGATFGRPVRRVEDPELLRGAGRYVGDLDIAGVADLRALDDRPRPIARRRHDRGDRDARCHHRMVRRGPPGVFTDLPERTMPKRSEEINL